MGFICVAHGFEKKLILRRYSLKYKYIIDLPNYSYNNYNN